MTHAMVTFVAPLALDKVVAAENAIDVLGNPASNAVQSALALQPNDQNGTHFASLHAIRSQDGETAYIVFEYSADGPDDVATSRIVSALGSMLKPVFMLSSDWSDGGDFAAFLKDHEVAINNGLSGNAGLPFDMVLSAEVFEHYKPDAETYLGAARLLCLPPEQVMMVAAHNNDLRAAQKYGLKTAFVARPTEYGPLQKYDFEANGEWDIVARDFGEVAGRMGC